MPFSAWKTVTFVAALRHDGMTAPMMIKGAMNGEAFLAYVDQCLVPTLKRGDIVVMDNVSIHKVEGGREEVAAVRTLPLHQAWHRRGGPRSGYRLPRRTPRGLRPCCCAGLRLT